ncbi:MAG: sodium:calcium antiporter [Candidatus Micrarchaeota archaeon]
MVLTQLVLIAAGFALLLKSSEESIKRVARLARHFNVSEFATSFLIVGVVAIFPELSIGINSALAGQPAFGVGIVLGSNVADLSLIIGLITLAAGRTKIHEHCLHSLRWFLVPLSLPVFLLLDGTLSRLDGIILIAAFFAYALFLLRERPLHSHTEKKAMPWRHVTKEIIFLCISLALLLVSGKIITDAAHEISLALSLPLLFVGGLLAVGTCLPELSFALRASQHKHGELGLGNVFGNVLADCMLSLGVIALIHPFSLAYPQLAITSGAASALAVALTLVMLGAFRPKDVLTRKEGAVLVAFYLAFIVFQTLLEKTLAG